jgi:hypothetical protein
MAEIVTGAREMAKTVLYAIMGFGFLLIFYRVLQDSGLLDSVGGKQKGPDGSFLDNEVISPVLSPIGEAETGIGEAVGDFFKQIVDLFSPSPSPTVAQGGPLGGVGQPDVSALVASYDLNANYPSMGVQQPIFVSSTPVS